MTAVRFSVGAAHRALKESGVCMQTRGNVMGIAASLSVIRWAIFRRAGDLPLLQGRSEASRPDHDFGGLRERVFRCPVLLPPVSNSVPSRRATKIESRSRAPTVPSMSEGRTGQGQSIWHGFHMVDGTALRNL